MKIFITGATGYIGGMVSKKLKNRRHDIVALVRNKEKAEMLEELGYSTVIGDMLSPFEWMMEAMNSEVIVHCAQIMFRKHMGEKWVKQAKDADQKALSALIDSIRDSTICNLLIYTSGISVAGDNGDHWVDEDSLPMPGHTVGSYHLAGEKLAQKAIEEGLPIVILRPSLPVSDGGSFSTFFLQQAQKGKLQFVGNGKNYFPTVHGDDLANAYALAIEKKPIGETIIIADDEPLTMADFTNTLLTAFGKTAKSKGAPKWIVSLFAGKPLANLLTSSFRVKNDKAKALLGWQPQYRIFTESLEQVMQSQKSNTE